MNAQPAKAPALSAAEGLGHCYRLLGAAFAYPQEDMWRVMANGDFAEALVETLETALPGLARQVESRLGDLTLPSDTSLTKLTSDYLAIFELDVPTPAVSLYEGSYVLGSDRAGILLEVKGFYQNFGLLMAENLREPEDHLAAELEFLQFLTFKQAAAERAGQDSSPYLRAQRDFLDRHLTRWLPAYEMKARSIDSAFYRSLSWLAAALVAEHLALLEREAFSRAGDPS